MKRFDLTTLRLFVAVVEDASITKAAKRQHIAVSAASRRIAELESMLGQKLLSRSREGVRPTASGLTVFHHAQSVFRSLQDLEGEVVEYSEGVRGIVRIWASITSVVQYLPEEFASFASAHPKIAIELQEQASPHVVRAVVDGRCDIGIASATVPMSDLETVPYRSDRYVLVTPRDHPLARLRSVCFEDIIGCDLVGLPAGSSLDVQLRTAAQLAGRPIRMAIQVSSWDAACRMIQARVGVGIVPKGIADLHSKSLGIATTPLRDDWASLKLVICSRGRRLLSAAARFLFDQLSRRA